MNVAVVRGCLSRPPEERVLPSGDRLAVLEVRVDAPAQAGGRLRVETVPLAWFDAPRWAVDLRPEEEIVALGRVRRRFFRSGAGLQSRTELVVEAAAPARRPARTAEVVARAAAALHAGTDGPEGAVRRR